MVTSAQNGVITVSDEEASPSISIKAIDQSTNNNTSIDSFFSFPRSNFTNKQGFGKDPFFPHSKRREPKKLIPSASIAPSVAPLSVIETEVRLEGISYGQTRRIALINGKTYEQGETKPVTAGESQVSLKCLLIRKNSVLVKFIDQNQLRVLKIKDFK